MKHEDPRPLGGGENAISDVAQLRQRARRDIECGAVTDSYGADREAVLSRFVADLSARDEELLGRLR